MALVKLFLTLALLSVLSCSALGALTIESATRKVDLTQSYASATVELKVSGEGESYVQWIFHPDVAPHVAFFGAKTASGSPLSVSKPSTSDQGVTYKIVISALKASESRIINLSYVLVHTIIPYPAEIQNQAHQQLVKHLDHAHIYSLYTIDSQTSTFTLASDNVEHFTEVSPSSKSKSTIKYGPYKSVKELTVTPITLHYESSAQFLTIKGASRDYEVSHWGNLAVEDRYADVHHTGVLFKGNFDRLRFGRQPSPSAITTFQQILPADAADIYYRDSIGNISTSHVHVNSDSVTVFDIKPRFPLLGGWRDSFYTGYNRPLSSALSYDNEKGNYVLKVPFAEPIRSAVLDDYELRVILPEGASDIRVSVPFPIDDESMATHVTYLDTYGRPVVVVKKSLVVEPHRQDIRVTYSFSTIKMLQEPILLIVGVFCVLVGIVFASYLISSPFISKNKAD